MMLKDELWPMELSVRIRTWLHQLLADLQYKMKNGQSFPYWCLY